MPHALQYGWHTVSSSGIANKPKHDQMLTAVVGTVAEPFLPGATAWPGPPHGPALSRADTLYHKSAVVGTVAEHWTPLMGCIIVGF